MARRDRAAAATRLLEPGEELIVELDGVVPGFSRWSGIGGIAGVLLALSVPRLLDLSFLVGAVAIVLVLGATFLILYAVVGKPMAARHDPPLSSPYIALALTNRRVLLLDRALGGDASTLVEQSALRDISTIRHRPANMIAPHRLGYVVDGKKRRSFEFPRSERVGDFIERFER